LFSKEAIGGEYGTVRGIAFHHFHVTAQRNEQEPNLVLEAGRWRSSKICRVQWVCRLNGWSKKRR